MTINLPAPDSWVWKDPEVWVGVDLDGTLADSRGPRGNETIGPPIPAMVELVRTLIAAGIEVRIMTARVSIDQDLQAQRHVKDWCRKHIGFELLVTCRKDYGMLALIDDRAYHVEENSGVLEGVIKW